jgi:hypothetical protein
MEGAEDNGLSDEEIRRERNIQTEGTWPLERWRLT